MRVKRIDVGLRASDEVVVQRGVVVLDNWVNRDAKAREKAQK